MAARENKMDRLQSQNGHLIFDQAQYWQRLHQLSKVESEDYLRIYDLIAKNKQVTETVRLLMSREMVSFRVYQLSRILVTLIESMEQARSEKDLQRFNKLHAILDEINIAVNAWQNHICLKHSSVLYGHYRQLLKESRNCTQN